MHRLLDSGNLVSMHNTGATDGGKQIDLFLDALTCCKVEKTYSFVVFILKNPLCDGTASLP